ncbi:MAG TPA: DNA alkylation repair protein [Bdellovibrionales bacterium]|nr:DNA alkylation repair protein [Bdellovibrionales bacterium]
MKLQSELRARFKSAADPERAPQMEAYMKNRMRFYGVPAPLVKAVCRETFKGVEFKDQSEWLKLARELWDTAKRREEWYATIQLCEHRSARAFQDLAAMPLYEHFIVTGAWWDVVDVLASHHVGNIHKKFPKEMKPLMRAWSVSDDLWKRRTSILSQLSFGEETDLSHLYACIKPSLASKEFFLQKAIGWALRQYAWVDPKETLRYVRQNESRLAPLSKREALKNIVRKKAAK